MSTIVTCTHRQTAKKAYINLDMVRYFDEPNHGEGTRLFFAESTTEKPLIVNETPDQILAMVSVSKLEQTTRFWQRKARAS